jgi:carbonic anhydrase
MASKQQKEVQGSGAMNVQKGMNVQEGKEFREKHSPSVVNMKAQEALQRLKDGNEKFAKGVLVGWDVAKRRQEIASGQQPYAAIVDCSDSRVAPEYVFNARLGDIFVVRKAGNFIESGDIGSLEYAAEHLHVPLIVVMGHQRCGAMTAACSSGKAEGHIAEIVKALQPAAIAGKGDVEESSRQNVKIQIERMREKSEIIRKLEQEGKLAIVGAFYSLDTGKVEFF